MTLVRMAVGLYAKTKHVPGYLKQQTVEWTGEEQADQVEGYTTSDGKIVLEIHRGKINIDNARKALPNLEREKAYNDNQIGKINAEIREGRLGRKGDLSKFEAKLSEVQNELRINNDLIDSAVVDRIEFLVEDCN